MAEYLETITLDFENFLLLQKGVRERERLRKEHKQREKEREWVIENDKK